MDGSKHIRKTFIFFLLFITAGNSPAFCQEHINEMDRVRASMAEFGNTMPDVIKEAEGPDIRTLERIFEMNNYALTTIEAYLKMLKIALSSEKEINGDIINVLNSWLEFINRYTERDIEYIDGLLSETKDQSTTDMLIRAKKDMEALRDAASAGKSDNNKLLTR